MCCRSEKRASSEKQDLGPRRFTNIGHRKPAYVFVLLGVSSVKGVGRDQVAEETFGVSEVVAGG